MLMTPTNEEPLALENLELLRILTHTTYKQGEKKIGMDIVACVCSPLSHHLYTIFHIVA